MKRVTIKDIATHLSISVSTVSRALADDKNIRRETKEFINNTAEKLGYRRNILASNLRKGRSDTIGVIINEITSPAAAQILQGIQLVMQQKGIRVLISSSDNSSDLELNNIRLMESSMVDGIIMVPCHNTQNCEELRRLEQKGIPVVFLANTPKGVEVSGVVMNSYDKSCFLMEHLIRSGRKKIVSVRGPQATENMVNIQRAYIDSLAKFKIQVDNNLIIDTDLSVDDGQRVADELLSKKVDFDAIFACSELVAIGIMNRLRDRGIRVPNDVSIAGFFGSSISKMVYPRLTTIEPQHDEMGSKAAELLLDRLQHPHSEPKKVVIDAKIELRESTHGKL